MARFCRSCLFYEGMRMWLHPATLPDFVMPMRLDEDGRCSACTAYRRWRSEPLLKNERAQLEGSEVRRAVVLFSGGKDSTALLHFAQQELGFEVSAVLFDNGLIPARAIEQAQRICEALSVELTVVSAARLGDRSVQDALETLSPESQTPCPACARGVFRAAFAHALDKKTPWIFQGTNYFAELTTVPRALKHVRHEGSDFRLVNVPYLFATTRQQTLNRLRTVGFESIPLAGVSTNCSVPGRVQARLAQPLGHVPELEDLSLEVMVGHLTRESALAELAEKAPAHTDLLHGAL